MSEQPLRTQARTVLGRWPGLVWAVPLAAVLIVAYLGLHAFANRGVDVVVVFTSAAGARIGDTKVIYRGLEVGHVTKVALDKDPGHVDIGLRLDHNLKSVLRTGTRFWLIGANPGFDFSSLKAAVSGLSIGMSPGPGDPARRFKGLDDEPVVAPNTPGSTFRLDIDTVGAIRRGSTVLYRGYEAGRVLDVRPAGPGAFTAQIFVQAPFDQDVRTSSLFWNASAVQFSLTGQGISGSFNSPTTAFAGGVAFDTPTGRAGDPRSPPGARFPLYSDLGRAQEGPDGPQVQYQTTFHGAAGALALGSPVTFGGARVGVVNTVGLEFDPNSGVVSNPVTFGLYPQRLHIPGADIGAKVDWRAVSDGAVRKLLQLGYRVTLDQSPPLIGARFLTLAKVTGAGAAALAQGGAYPDMPSATGDASDLYAKADDLLTKVDALPIEAIGRDVRQITSHLSGLVSSPQVSDSLAHLDSTLASVDQMVKQVKPQIGPLITKLDQAADQLQQTATSADQVLSGRGAAQDASLPGAIRQLTDAARAVRALADYLTRHPDAVIKGKAKDAQ